jgi:hypothetical protein
MRRLVLPALLAALPACSCSGFGLHQAKSQVGVSPTAISYGDVYLSATPKRELRLVNTGKGSDRATLTFLSPSTAFRLSETSATLSPGTHLVQAVFSPLAAGPQSVTVRVAWSNGSADVLLDGNGLDWPDCSPSGPCEEASFDPNTGVCTKGPKADGAACDSGLTCVDNARCLGGQCLGSPKSCDDHSVCTNDFCIEGKGCQHEDTSGACQGGDPCLAYFCDPTTGCGSAAVPDGTPCSLNQNCERAELCIQGKCVGTPVPDGTPCVLWWAPCAKDSTCQGGDCHSPTAEAEQPGNVRWIAPSPYAAAGSNGGWRAAAAVDGFGTAYLDDDIPEGPVGVHPADLVAIDTCGQEKWRAPAHSSRFWTNGRHAIDRDQIVSVLDDETVGADYLADGSKLWRVDLRPSFGLCDTTGQPLGCVQASSFQIQDLALSNGGRVYLGGEFVVGDKGPDYHRFLAALLTNGYVEWAKEVGNPGTETQGRFGYPLNVDGDDHLYSPFHNGNDPFSYLQSFDRDGNARWSVSLPDTYLRPLALGASNVLEGVTLSSVGFDGTLRWKVGPDASAQNAFGHSPVIDARGNSYLARTIYKENGQPLPVSHGEVVALDASGNLLWETPMPAGVYPTTSLVLGENDRLFIGTYPDPSAVAAYAGDVRAYDAASGAELWRSAIPGDGQVYSGVLALADTATLVVSTRVNLVALFAGKLHMPRSAPWPRFRGDNTNRSSPRLPGPP